MLRAMLSVALLIAATPADAGISKEGWACRKAARGKMTHVEFQTRQHVLPDGRVVTTSVITPESWREFNRHYDPCMCRHKSWWHPCHWRAPSQEEPSALS